MTGKAAHETSGKALAVFVQAVQGNLRDRRTLVSAFLVGPLLVPLLFALMMGVPANRPPASAGQLLHVSVIGAPYAPNLLAALREGGVVAGPPVADPAAAVRRRDADLVLRVPADYGRAWRAGEPAQVELYFDASRTETQDAVQRLNELVAAYARTQGALRLVARGLSPGIARPVQVAPRDQAPPPSRALRGFAVLPCLFVVALFMGGRYLAIDLAAGGHAWPSTSANAVARGRILLGRLAAVSVFSLASLGVTVLVFSLVGKFIVAGNPGMEFDPGWRFAGVVLALMAPLALLLAALQMWVAAFARSDREAQAHVTLLMVLSLIPSALPVLMPIKAQAWMYAVPLLGQSLGIAAQLRGDGPGGGPWALCLAGSLAAAWLVQAVHTITARPAA